VKGSTYKRCKCPAQYDAKGNRRNCRKDHGSWYYVADVGFGPDGKRRQERKGGFRTADAAEQALSALLARVGEGTYTPDEGQTVGTWLDTWLEGKERAGLRQSTARAYRGHIDQYLRPHLGRTRLRDLRPQHVDQLLITLDNGKRKAATVRRIHATLRSALTTAVRRRLVTFNAAKDVDLPVSQQPKMKPWEPAELGTFLDSIGGHRLGALFETIAGTGMRRGEAVGLRWDDVDLARRVLIVRQQIVHVAGRRKNGQGPAPCPYCAEGHYSVAFGLPKTKSGEDRTVDLDDVTVGALIEHRFRQQTEREQWGEAYADHGLVFALEDGNPLPPDDVTKLFVRLVNAAGLRRVRLHDLRHGHASVMLAANIEPAVVSKRLGHSSIAITLDTYSHLLAGVGRDAADRASALVPRSPKAPAADLRDHSVTTSPADSVTDAEKAPFTQVSGGVRTARSAVDSEGRKISCPQENVPPGDDR